jgi:hypothetical protein
MESFQKRARERRKREKQAEKQARRHDRSAGQTDAREGAPGDPSLRPLPPALHSNDGAPAESPSTTRPST